MKKTDDEDVKKWKSLVEEYLKDHKKIDDEMFERFFGKKAQAEFLSGKCDDLTDAMIMGGLSGIDCRDYDFSRLSPKNYTKIPFDSDTKFPEEIAHVFDAILEKSKEFGFGLEGLIQDGKLSGEGIHVAIIDENIDMAQIDTDDINIVSHDEYSSGNHYHGKITSSLLASKSCGVAKGASLHFYEKTSEEYRREADERKSNIKDEESKQEFKNWKKVKSAEDRGRTFSKIVEYNKNCENESDKITVVSGSWSLPNSEFLKWQQEFRKAGCELVCQNNFIQNFTEISGDDVILDMTEEEKDGFSESMRRMVESSNLDELVKIPINRTYHRYGDATNFKYQATYSNSWGIPQVAGLLALYKAKDRSLTFEQFCDLCRETASEKGVINPVGIYEQIEKKLENEKKVENPEIKQEEKPKTWDDDEGR